MDLISIETPAEADWVDWMIEDYYSMYNNLIIIIIVKWFIISKFGFERLSYIKAEKINRIKYFKQPPTATQ